MTIGDEIDVLTRDGSLAVIGDGKLEMLAAAAIYDAAVMNGSRYADKYHARVDLVYDECRRRERGIYQRAWNRAVCDGGHPELVSPVKDGDV